MPVSLIVPVNLQALCVGTDDATSVNPYGTGSFAALGVDFSKMPYVVYSEDGTDPVAVSNAPNYSETVVNPPFATTTNPLPSGIHLHWALPDALAQGVTGSDGSVAFRTAPNRWLVVRVAVNYGSADAPTTAVKGWVVESDAVWDQATAGDPLPTNRLSRAITLNPPPSPSTIPNQPFQTLGRAFPYETWVEGQGGSRAAPFTAVGYGEVSYSAAYPHAPNVFGFYDDMSGLVLTAFPPATSRVSYMVLGWYSDPLTDPLAQLAAQNADATSLTSAIETQFGWVFATDTSGSVPGAIVCNGLLTNIEWNPQTTYLTQPSSASVQVAVGNTAAEAVSALLAHQPGLSSLPNVELVLNALQLGLLQRLPKPDGLMQVEEAMHAAAFGSTSAGHIWVVQPATPANTNTGKPVQITGSDLLTAASALQQPMPQTLADDLNQLNILQQQCDALARQIDAYRGQIFVDWYKYMNLAYPGMNPPNVGIDSSDALNYTNQVTIAALNGLVNTAYPALLAQVQQQATKVGTDLGQAYTLKCIAAPRYYQANDLVVLLSGTDFTPTYRPADPRSYDVDGNLICRLATNVITTLTVQSAKQAVTAGALPQLPASTNQSHVSDVAALFAEAFFLDPNQSFVLAQAAAGSAAGGLWEQIRLAQQNLLSGGTPNPAFAFNGIAPAPVGYAAWQQPWLPLLLQWEVSFYPIAPIDDGSATTYTPDFITSTFNLDEDAIDLVYPRPIASTPPPPEVYQGTAPLTHSPEIGITAQIQTFLDNYPDSQYASELQQVLAGAGPPLMAQALGGLHQAMVMRRQTLQLQVSDPLAVLSGSMMVYNFSNVTVPAAVGDQNTVAPVPDSSFNPIRAGFLRLNRLWVVDMFGQTRQLTPAPVDVIRAASLVPLDDTVAVPFLSLPPRITQPNRLLFRWLAADNDAIEMNSDPATTPVCGWVLFNHLDDNLMIYDASGNPLGSLNMRGPLWTGAPGNNATYDQPIETALSGTNQHLQDFVLGIYHNPKALGFLQDLLNTIDATITMVNPQSSEQYQAMSVLIGRPLALVRASLALDLHGPAVLNQSWTSFVAAVNGSQPFPARDTAAMQSVTFPVRLGDLANINDGLIGYFIDNGSAGAFQTFYAAASTSGGNGVVPPEPNQLTVSPDPAAAPVLLSMLVDPRASVHATAGILPIKDIQIPPYMFSAALTNMAVTFLSTPVLSSAAQLAVPVPKEDGYAWSWVSVDPQTKKWNTASFAPVSLNGADFSVQQAYEGWLKLAQQPPTK